MRRRCQRSHAPDPAEWDFHCVSSEFLEPALTWEYARESAEIRERVLHWLDTKNSVGKTIREIKVARFNNTRPIDPESFRKLPTWQVARAARAQKIEAENAAMIMPPINWNYGAEIIRRFPPSARVFRPALLWEMLTHYGHEFPKSWPKVYADNRGQIWSRGRNHPLNWQPASLLFWEYNAESLAQFEELHKRVARLEGAAQVQAAADLARILLGAFRSTTNLEALIGRAWIFEFDFENITKDAFFAGMERFWKQRLEDRELNRRRRKLRGQAGRLPWAQLTWLSASRLRKSLSIAESRRLAQERPSKRRETAATDFVLPQYLNDSAWTNALKKARQEIDRFEREVLPHLIPNGT